MKALTRLPAMRARAQSRMTSRATVRRRTGRKTQGPNGREVPEWAEIGADLPFRLGGIYGGAATTREVDTGGVEVQTSLRVGHFPASTTGLVDGDLVDVTAGENAGLAFVIVEADWQDQATALRVPLRAVERPKEWP